MTTDVGEREKVIEELRRKLSINRHRIDAELVEQPTLYYRASELHIHNLGLMDKMKDNLKVLYAKLDVKYRKEEGKTTETALKQRIELNEQYQRANRKLLEYKKWTNLFEAMKTAYAQRAFVLKDVAQVMLSRYYGEGDTSVKKRSNHDKDYT